MTAKELMNKRVFDNQCAICGIYIDSHRFEHFKFIKFNKNSIYDFAVCKHHKGVA